MVRHEAVSMDLPAGLEAGFAEGVQEPLTIVVIAEDEFAMIAAIQDVVNRAGVLDTKFAGHARNSKRQGSNLPKLGTDPFPIGNGPDMTNCVVRNMT